MSEFQLVMPKMGESIAEATIIRWTKNEGDSIALDETVLEIATDKVDSEVPSPKAGTLVKRLFNEGDVVPVNSPIDTCVYFIFCPDPTARFFKNDSILF